MQEGILNFRNLAIGPHRCNPKLKIKAVFVLASNRFRKCFSVNAGVWLRMENKFSGNYFQLTGCFEGFDPEMVWSENFHFKPFSDSRAKTEREREPSTSASPITAFDFDFDFADFADHNLRIRLRRSTNPLIYEPITPSTSPITPSTSSIYEPTNRSSTQSLRPRAFDPWTFDFAGDPEPSRHKPIFDPLPSTQSHEPTNRSLSLCVILIFCVILINPRTHEPLISDFFVVVVVVLVVVFWWFSCCVVVGFVWVVVEISIFRMLPNPWKYFLEQFS